MSDKLKGKRCDGCGMLMLNPSFSCMNCGKDSLSEVEFIGNGKIYTYTVVHVAAGHLVNRTPYILAVVELEEGLKVLTIVEDLAVDSVQIGQSVKFKRVEENTGPIFQAV